MEPLLPPGLAPMRGYATLPSEPRRHGQLRPSKGRFTAMAVFAIAATLLVALVFTSGLAARRVEDLTRFTPTGPDAASANYVFIDSYALVTLLAASKWDTQDLTDGVNCRSQVVLDRTQVLAQGAEGMRNEKINQLYREDADTSEGNQIRHKGSWSSLGALGLHAPTNWFMKTQQFVGHGHGIGIKNVLDEADSCQAFLKSGIGKLSSNANDYGYSEDSKQGCTNAGCKWIPSTMSKRAQCLGSSSSSSSSVATNTVTSEECAKHSSTIGSNKDACVAAKCEWRDGSYAGGYCIIPGSHFVEEYRSKQTPAWSQRSCQQLLCSQTPPITDNGASLAFWQRSNAKADEQLDICVTIATVFMECQKMSPGKRFGLGPSKSTVEEASKQCKQHPACFWEGVMDPKNTAKEVGGQCEMKDSYDTSKITPKNTSVQSWKNEQACKFELQATQRFQKQEAEKREAEKVISPEDVAESVEKRDAIADKVGKAPERRELVKFQAQGNDPNATPFEPAEYDDSDCMALPELPGATFLASGYDPEVNTPCEFDDCRTTRIFTFTYDTCTAIHTPGGTFKVPDQITVLNKYETYAHTNVYQTQEDKDFHIAAHAELSTSCFGGTFSGAMRGSGGQQSSKETHVADRKIDVKLYTLYLDPMGATLNPELLMEVERLPPRFAADPHGYLRLLRKWGRYAPKSASYGGTVIIEMKFETAANNMDWAFGVEAAFDSVTSGRVGVEGQGSTNGLMANSQISLIANGGDPQVAAAVTDFTPATNEAITFRNDLQVWLKTVPWFPRLVERVPPLMLISDILPEHSKDLEGKSPEEIATDRLTWTMRKRAIKQAIEVMVASSKAAMHSSSQDCTPNFAWKDYNRFSTNQCLSFGIRSPGDIDIAIAEMPTRPEGALILHIGVEETLLQTWDKVGKTWTKIWLTKSNLALATGSHALMSKFWLCVSHNNTSGQSASLTFGVRDTQIVELQVNAFEPRYFALKCSGFDGSFTSIDVHPYDVWMGFISGKKSVVAEAVCSISRCGTLIRGGNTPGTCRCMACQAGYELIYGDGTSSYDFCAKQEWKVQYTSIGFANSLNEVDFSQMITYLGCFKDSNDRALPQNKELASRGYALMTTCTKMAVQDKSAGFCIEANLACELPNPGSDLDSFWKAASSKGQSTFACDPTYPNGADWTMACYEVQKPGQAWFSETATFETYESLRKVVPVLPVANYAWKITGTLKFSTNVKVKWCCRGDDEVAVFIDRSPSAVVRETYANAAGKCTDQVYTYAKEKPVYVEIQGLQKQGAVYSAFYYKYSQDDGATWSEERNPKAYQDIKNAASLK